MDRRDRTVAGGLALALAVIVFAIGAPALVPSSGAEGQTSPSPSAVVSSVYREGMVGRPTSINPLTARTEADRALVGLVFAGLLRLAPGDNLRPDLAEWWRPEDGGAAWVVRIADAAVWHDGEPVTAADVEFTVAALADPALNAPQGPSWANVAVEVVDDRTVRFVLPEPLGGFPWLLTQPLAPAHLLGTVPLETMADDPFGEAPVGSGPFRMLGWDASAATLEAVRPDDPPAAADRSTSEPTTGLPSRAVPWLRGLDVVFYEDQESLVTDLERAALDGIVGAPDSATAAAGARLLSYPGTTLSTIVLDLRPDHKELRDARVRTALMAAVDRDAVIASVVDGQAGRADAPIPPSSSLFDPVASPTVAHDQKAAAKLLLEAGWKRLESKAWAAPDTTKPFSLTILVPPGAVAPHLLGTATAVATDWTTFGIKTVVEEVPFGELVDRLHAGEFTVAVVDVAIGHDPDLYPLLASSQVVSDGLNVSGIQDPKLDKLLVTARRAMGDEARKAAYSELQTYLAARRYLLTLYFRDLPFVVSDRLDGPSVHQVAQAGDRYWDVLTWRLASSR
ncbi:MAG TPA: ABC transporter substrate-binding protein [Candidatus Limnocylindrales bacterium]|nr:ABC transporter substrate-binding protein [Candidatus Limnocylindrales bacterium]